MTNLTLPPDFTEKLRQQVLGAFLDAIPAQKFNELVDDAVKAFFDESKQLELGWTKNTIPNPSWTPGSSSWTEKTVNVDVLAIKTTMSTFTQMVWTMLHAHAQQRLKEHFEQNGDVLKQQFNAWFESDAAEMVDKAKDNKFSAMLRIMSAGMFQGVAHHAEMKAMQQLQQVLRNSTMRDSHAPLAAVMNFRDGQGNSL